LLLIVHLLCAAMMGHAWLWIVLAVHPDQTAMYLAAVDVTGGWEYNIGFWDNVYGMVAGTKGEAPFLTDHAAR